MFRKYRLLYIAVFIILLGFSIIAKTRAQPHHSENTSTIFFKAAFSINALQYDSLFSAPHKTGVIKDSNLHEASGLAASRRYKGYLWTHNDSGNPNDIYLIDQQGNKRAILSLDGYEDRDWEDIAIGPGPVKGENYLYISETGDNHLRYNTYYIYRFTEPVVHLGKTLQQGHIKNIDKIAFTYPDGPHNAEALMIDPKTKDLYIVTKSKVSDEAYIYELPYPQSTTSISTPKKIGFLPIRYVTAADISADGNEILIKSLHYIFYWKRANNATVAATLSKLPRLLPYKPEPKGEAICFSKDDNAFFTLSEYGKAHTPQVIYKYNRKK